MKKVITYGTFDLLHYGHIRLLERAKELGDYLIVAVTADDFDKRRGKINVQQSLIERVDGVKSTGLADEIIIEEYEGQKIDDIINYGIDVFVVGSDWVGKFDYLKEYCEVVYLERTKGVSSTQLRSDNSQLKLGIVGNHSLIKKSIEESKYANGLVVNSLYTNDKELKKYASESNIKVYDDYNKFLASVDAIYIVSSVEEHFNQAQEALENQKHVLCESPISLKEKECKELFDLAKKKNLVFMESIKTAYSIAFNRLILLAKSGVIGNIVSIDSTCTSLRDYLENSKEELLQKQNSMCGWAPTALLPVFKLLGTDYKSKRFTSYFLDKKQKFDLFTKIDFIYDNAMATVKVGKGVKSEGELIISGTKGYIYVPAPWWKTDYFEIRYEDPLNNKRYFYQLDGEGIRNQFVTFVKLIQSSKAISNIDPKISEAISSIIEDFNNNDDLEEINI